LRASRAEPVADRKDAIEEESGLWRVFRPKLSSFVTGRSSRRAERWFFAGAMAPTSEESFHVYFAVHPSTFQARVLHRSFRSGHQAGLHDLRTRVSTDRNQGIDGMTLTAEESRALPLPKPPSTSSGQSA
jgi:hypothetical protein